MKLAEVMEVRDAALDWARVYWEWPGRLNRTNCWESCRGPHRCCLRPLTLILLPGEGAFLRGRGVAVVGDTYVCPGGEHCLGALRPVCCRTYPVAPDAAGNLYADSACSQHKWASWHFLCQTAKAWRVLLAQPGIPEWVERMRREHYGRRAEVAVDEIEREFDAGYSATFGHYHSGRRSVQLLEMGIIRSTDRVLIAGCGRGQSVARLREQGINAWGVDINPALVAGTAAPGFVLEGDVRGLPFPDGSFDLAITVDVLEHMADYELAIAELARVSRWRVYVEVTPLECAEDLFEDPTHCVFLRFADWQAAVAKHLDIEVPAAVGEVRRGLLCRVRVGG